MNTMEWDSVTPSPELKLEHSPAESFLSVPGEMYPPLFGSSSSSAASATSTINPVEVMTPQTFAEDKPDVAASTPTPEPTTGEKKTKKRKSWGQVLPEPKTSLPPRKRAKTEDEKEQRRVERVLRNRRAAQSSRERKRQEVEQLERRNKELEAMVSQLYEELQRVKSATGVTAPLRPTGVTFSQELFSSQDSIAGSPASIGDLFSSVTSPNTTVNPASLSPALTPIAEDDDEDTPATSADATPATPNAASPDSTHPAVMLCQDLQCLSAEEPRSSVVASTQPLHPALALFLPLQFLLTCTSAALTLCQRPLMQIAMSLKAGFSLPPTLLILNTIVWLVTNPATSASRAASTSTSTTSSTTTSSTDCPESTSAQSRPTPRSSSLRLSLLRKILTCSPNLARPLTDATMAALRLASTEGHDVSRAFDGAGALAVDDADDASGPALTSNSSGTAWLDGAELPPREVLITLLWALQQIEQGKIPLRRRKSSTSPLRAKLGRRRALTVANLA